jgi:hypothetical protein
MRSDIMKARNALLIIGTAAVCMALASCGGNGGNNAYMPPASPPSAAPPSQTMDLGTVAVLTIIQTMTSETAAPFKVDGGVVAVTPVGDETSAPISVDST